MTNSPPETAANVLDQANTHLQSGRISQLADLLGRLSQPHLLPPDQYSRFAYLTLCAALYGFGDLEQAKSLNAGLPGKVWVTMRYRLALRQKDFATAARIRRLPGVTEQERWDFRCTLGLHLIWGRRYKWGFHFYQDRWHAINFPKILPGSLLYHPPGNPADDPPRVVLEQGVGECLLALMHLRANPPAEIIADPKYRRLIRRILPQARFVPVNDIPADLQGARALCSADLLGRAWRQTGSFTPPLPLTTPLRDHGAAPIYGICWRGGSGQNRREERHIPLHLFLDLLPAGARYLPLQFDITEAEKLALAADRRCQPSLVDVTRDPEEVLQIVRRLAGVISVDSANWHFAGAAGVPLLALMNRRAHWFWGPEARAEWTYPTATTLAKTAMSRNVIGAWMQRADAAWMQRPGPEKRNRGHAHRPILVAGLPRSGTSMTMQILAQHGVWVGQTLKATSANPQGFYENVALKNAVIKRLLADVGADPLGVAPLPDTDNLPILPDLDQRIHGLIAREGYDGRSPWAFKDPKLTLIWPVLARAFPDAHWIIPRRNRDAVIRSLTRVQFMRRHSSDPEYWSMFCAAYDQRILALAESGARVTVVDTDALAAGDHSALEQVLLSVGITPQPEIFRNSIDTRLFGQTGGQG